MTDLTFDTILNKWVYEYQPGKYLCWVGDPEDLAAAVTVVNEWLATATQGEDSGSYDSEEYQCFETEEEK